MALQQDPPRVQTQHKVCARDGAEPFTPCTPSFPTAWKDP